MQAMEVIKLITGIGSPLIGKLLHYDSLNNTTRKFNLKKDPNCLLCATDAKELPLGWITKDDDERN